MPKARYSEIDQLNINTIRMLAVDAVQAAESGHPGMPMGMAAPAYVLWTRFLRINPANPCWADRDRFILSGGHGSMLLYALLHLSGYPLPLDELKRFRQWGSLTPGHPEYGLTTGVETTTGPLGQGFGNGVGMAIAERYLAEVFNQPNYKIVDHYTYALCGDGDMMEGVASEAASLAGHLGLGKMIYLYDDNHITIEGETSLAFTEDVVKRFDAYGWHTQAVDGLDLEAIEDAIRAARAVKDRPSLIACRTHIAYGSPNKHDTAGAHGEPLGKEEVRLTKENLGWPADKEFYVPDETRGYFAELQRYWRSLEANWHERFENYRRELPDLAHQFEAMMAGELPEGWQQRIPQFAPGKPIATRSAGGEVMNAIAPAIPGFIGGSADLAPSTKTYLKGFGDQEKGRPGGRNMHFGVREHGMGATVNGMALHGGLWPFGATFFVFSDYMRPSVRLSAIMQAPVVWIFTHDSIFVGEDGPTHEPIEHLAALRAIPHLTTIRPADANETAAAWQVALESKKPTALILSRQNLPVFDRTQYPAADNLRKGAYTMVEPDATKPGLSEKPGLSGKGKKPDMILIGTGSEVSLAIDAQKALLARGIRARVVSMPSWELFEAQPQSYRDEVLPANVPVRLAVEAGSPMGWDRYTGAFGGVLGIENRFGASAPYKALAEHYGFTVDNVVAQAEALLRSFRDKAQFVGNILACSE